MGHGESKIVRFRLRSLLIATAAVAAMAALSSRAMAFLTEVTRDPRNERALTLVALSVAAIVPLAFVLVIGFTKVGLSSRRRIDGWRGSDLTDDPGD